MRRPKVAHVSSGPITLRYQLLNQLVSIKEAGYEVVGISSPGPEAATIEAAGIRHIPVPITRNLTPFADLRSLLHLSTVMRRERFTLVHTHNPKPGLLGQVAARMAGVPIVINTVHGFYLHEHMHPLWRLFYISMEKLAARCSDVILSQSSEDIETAIREGICSPQKIKYLGNGIDVHSFNRKVLNPGMLAEKRLQLGISPGAPVVGFVGRLVAEKGILELLQAARHILEQLPTTRFLIIGAVDKEKSNAVTAEAARDYGVAEACIFTGVRHDMPEMYALMNVFTLPSHREGFPRSVMEASSMGVPCVATDVRGCREAVEHGRNGLLVPLRDTKALASAVITLLTDVEKSQQMSREGRRIALARFDEAKVFERIKEEYARLLLEKSLAKREAYP